MIRYSLLAVLLFAFLCIFSSPVMAWGAECEDPSIPGSWRICESSIGGNMDFGIIFYSESVLAVLSDGSQIMVSDYPRSWDFYYGDYFIFEKPDLWDSLRLDEEIPMENETEETEESMPRQNYDSAPPGSMVAIFWEF